MLRTYHTRRMRMLPSVLLALAVFVGVFFCTILFMRIMRPANTHVLNQTTQAIGAGDFKTAKRLWDEDIVNYPEGRARKNFDAVATAALNKQVERFIHFTTTGPIQGDQQLQLVGLGLFEDTIRTKMAASLDTLFSNFAKNMQGYDEFKIILDNYRLIEFTQPLIAEREAANAALIAARRDIQRADNLKAQGQKLEAAELYHSITKGADAKGYEYIVSFWPAFSAELVVEVRASAGIEADAKRYASALRMVDEALAIIPGSQDLLDYRAELKNQEAAYSHTLVDYTGRVEHIFTHNLLVYPQNAFSVENNGANNDADCMTAIEFERMLTQLYNNNYVLIDINLLWEPTPTGSKPVTTIKIPAGKKPLVLSLDDVNYRLDQLGKGMIGRLVIDEENSIAAETTVDGQVVRSYDEHIPALEKFIEAHPDFSFNNARGTIAVTGYTGMTFGYCTRLDISGMNASTRAAWLSARPDAYNSIDVRKQERAEATRVADRLKELGWTFASHTFGHINIDRLTVAAVRTDCQQWRDEVEPIVGKTPILIWSFGSSPSERRGERQKIVEEFGFRMFCGVSANPFFAQWGDVTFMDRRPIDGYNLRFRKDKLLELFDASFVYDEINRIPKFTIPESFYGNGNGSGYVINTWPPPPEWCN